MQNLPPAIIPPLANQQPIINQQPANQEPPIPLVAPLAPANEPPAPEAGNQPHVDHIYHRNDANTLPLCIICLDAPRRSILIPCAHLICCALCAGVLQAQGSSCPVFWEDIEDIRMVFCKLACSPALFPLFSLLPDFKYKFF